MKMRVYKGFPILMTQTFWEGLLHSFWFHNFKIYVTNFLSVMLLWLHVSFSVHTPFLSHSFPGWLSFPSDHLFHFHSFFSLPLPHEVSSLFHYATHLSPWKGLWYFSWDHPTGAYLSSPAPAGLLPASSWWRVCGAVWHLESRTHGEKAQPLHTVLWWGCGVWGGCE